MLLEKWTQMRGFLVFSEKSSFFIVKRYIKKEYLIIIQTGDFYMEYEPLRLKDFFEDIKESRYLLPAIQRDYVWKEEQIYSFLDSLMREYPVGAMLFWKKPKGGLYTFIRDYTTKKKPEPASFTEKKNAEYAVLDGQQRLTSLYIAFRGSFKEKKLYFNIASTNYNADMKYEFRFLSKGDLGSKKKMGFG